MHELGLCSSIVEAVERRADGRPVARAKVRVGLLHHVHPDAFEQSFAIAAAGGVAERASAELVLLPVQSRCTSCRSTWESGEVPTSCPACGGLGVELFGGDELVLESIEYERR